MSQRTTPTAVQTLLGSNYGPNPDGSLPDLQPYIDSVTGLIDYVVQLAAQRDPGAVSLPGKVQERMECWMAAHAYTKMDPTYSSKSAGGASGSFVRNAQEAEPYLDGAFMVDYSGTLRAVVKRQVASASWMGKACADQVPFWLRTTG